MAARRARIRSLAYALLAREGSDPLRGDDRVDRPWPRNQGLAGRLPPNWRAGRTDSGATVEMLAVLRSGTENETADRAADLLRRGIGPQSVWDALMCGGGEILMREPGIVPLHSVTTTNAINVHLRALAERRDPPTSPASERFVSSVSPQLAWVQRSSRPTSRRPSRQAQAIRRSRPFLRLSAGTIQLRRARCSGYLARNPNPKALVDAANRLVFLKGNDSHDYKFSAAVLED